MRPAATLGLYAGALALVFAAAVGVGGAVGPVGASTTAPDRVTHGADGHDEPAAAPAADVAAGGLAVAADGYALELASTTLAAGTPGTLQFTVVGPDGEPVTELTRSHDKDLHLIVVRRDLTGYQHLHPTRDAQGTWTVPLTLPEPGPYKVFADFAPVGRDRALTLAADLTAPGAYVPRPLPAPARTATVDGYEVAVDGALVAGPSSPLTLTVRRDGSPVTDLEPYLGAYGHLVALREGDLAYLHVHADGVTTTPGPDLAFSADVPSAASYRLFLDFAHAGVVRTAELTTVATRPGADAAPVAEATPSDHDAQPHGH